MTKNNFLVVVTDQELIDLKVTNVNFLFPITDYSVGFLTTFKMEEIKVNQAYIYINRILDEQSLKSLEELFKNIPKNIVGICFTDLGILYLKEKLNLDLQFIYMQNHNTTNAETINYYLEEVDSVLVSTDCTYEEVMNILDHAQKPLVVPYFSRVDVMYSRRTLLNNFQEEFAMPKKPIATLSEPISKQSFLAIENNYGTVLYHQKYIDYRKIKHPNILFSFINPLGISKEDVVKIMNGENILVLQSEGFLNQETYYRLDKEPEK